jgi:hypothetical protein
MEKLHKIIAIPIEKEIEDGDIVKNERGLYYIWKEEYSAGSLKMNVQQLLLLSDEEIKKNDCYYNERLNHVYQQTLAQSGYNIGDRENKIIASYPQLDHIETEIYPSGVRSMIGFPTFSEEFIQQWVENPIEEVEVEYEDYQYTINYHKDIWKDGIRLKNTSNNEVICSFPKVQLIESPCDFSNDPVILEEKVKEVTYTESDIKAIFAWTVEHCPTETVHQRMSTQPSYMRFVLDELYVSMKKWFDNHKKK